MTDVPTRPREWTLNEYGHFVPIIDPRGGFEKSVRDGERVRVLEAEPVERECEEMLNLLGKLDAYGLRAELREQIKVLMRKYGRLSA